MFAEIKFHPLNTEKKNLQTNQIFFKVQSKVS